MAKTNADDVLADLKSVGAVGGPTKTPDISESVVTEVEIEQGPPSVSVRDLRGGRAVEAIDAALEGIDEAVRGLEATREALVYLRRVWEPVDSAEEPLDVPVETPETVLSGPEPPEAPSTSQTSAEPSEGSQEPREVTPEEIARVRELARRKILGEDMTPEQRAAAEEEDSAPFVGQVRALPPGQEPEEITIGTVGTIKPSFPAEG